LAGFVAVFPPDRFIHHLYVSPDHLRCGIGRALFAAAVTFLGGTASLKCQTRNAEAVAFYRRLGLIPADAGESAVGPWVRMVVPSEERAAR
jgi:GNAT superfamily N-acetyltransferase